MVPRGTAAELPPECRLERRHARRKRLASRAQRAVHRRFERADARRQAVHRGWGSLETRQNCLE